jgi:hypothetical protein
MHAKSPPATGTGARQSSLVPPVVIAKATAIYIYRLTRFAVRCRLHPILAHATPPSLYLSVRGYVPMERSTVSAYIAGY